ncbi:hypothetical protein SAMN04487895_10829 [Paenibacillus sophorae]|uniref:Uncharacterized protein n=1 Tax=Paenibacillus sophorae TaxID=1333845 RepID=A0A1H8Q167_9BACL|nr:hypothetical protein [Paenibacillus sophorae]QWU15308.1 hypothetical protein KP014_26070 [Paenibacillus sophorae]SEO47982.1 hypothetical protein SAMN04487895_10829 [Paenibacillus sophorae]
MAQFFEVLYWFAMVGSSVVLAATTLLVCGLGVKFFIKDGRRALGAGCIAFSLVSVALIVFMINYKFILAA